MDKTYWQDRERASVAMARKARCSQSRLAHLDLAGRYSAKAANSACGLATVAGLAAPVVPLQPQLEDGIYYAQLEQGARFLASRSTGEIERSRHLSMANHYVKLKLDAGGEVP